MIDIKELPSVTLNNIRVSNLNKAELLDIIGKYCKGNDLKVIASGNIHSLNLAYKNAMFRDFINSADLIRNDSAGLMLASKLIRKPLKERITWADFGLDLAGYCAANNLKLFFLGDKPGIAKLAKEKLCNQFSGLKIVGCHHGYFTKDGEDNLKVINSINQTRADILVVGFGMPLQEKWIIENKHRLNVKVVLTGGNCFSFLSGIESRAPTWMHKNGLEWFYRFLKEPKRMFNRYIIGNPLFFIRIVSSIFKPRT